MVEYNLPSNATLFEPRVMNPRYILKFRKIAFMLVQIGNMDELFFYNYEKTRETFKAFLAKIRISIIF